MYIIGMFPAEEALSFTKQNLHAFLIFFWSQEYIEKNTNSRATISKYESLQTRHFHFWILLPKQWVVAGQTRLFLLHSVSGFPTLTVALWTTAHWLWLQFLLLSWGSWECRFCSDSVVWESAPLSIPIPLALHLHFLWRWDRVLVGSPDWTQTHHVPSSFSRRLGTLAHAIMTICFAHINASCRVFPVKAWGHVQA